MAVSGTEGSLSVAAPVLLCALVGYVFYALYSYAPSLPKGAPGQYVEDKLPVIGSLAFWYKRWDFFKAAMNHSKTGNFSFFMGKVHVVGLSGDVSRSFFFENRDLHFGHGYGTMLGQSPPTKANDTLLSNGDDEMDKFNTYLAARLASQLKSDALHKNVPHLISDARVHVDRLAAQKIHITDPFDSVYRMVFNLTMRGTCCHDFCDDQATLDELLGLFEAIEHAASEWSIIFPLLPTFGKMKKYWYGFKLYMHIERIAKHRRKTGERKDDTMQFLLDQGDSTQDIIMFLMGVLFAGQINSGINAAAVLMYLSNEQTHLKRAREELQTVCARYNPGSTAPLIDQLPQIPLSAWERDFPFMDQCLRDSIRLNLLGAAFRRNMSGHDIPIPSSSPANGHAATNGHASKSTTKTPEIVPAGAIASYHLHDVHMNPDIYPSPQRWDPSRYDRGEGEGHKHSFVGWGAGRHPCAGMRFAKLEQNVIIASFLARFEKLEYIGRAQTLEDLMNGKGERGLLPENNWNARSPEKPSMGGFVAFD